MEITGTTSDQPVPIGKAGGTVPPLQYDHGVNVATAWWRCTFCGNQEQFMSGFTFDECRCVSTRAGEAGWEVIRDQ